MHIVNTSEKENLCEFLGIIALGCWKVREIAAVLCFQAELLIPAPGFHTIMTFQRIVHADR